MYICAYGHLCVYMCSWVGWAFPCASPLTWETAIKYDKKENRYLSYTICTMPVYEIKKHSQKERCVFSTSSPVELLKSSFIPHLGALLPQEQVITNEMIF